MLPPGFEEILEAVDPNRPRHAPTLVKLWDSRGW